MWAKSALILFAVLSVRSVAAEKAWPPGVWTDLAKVQVDKFVADGLSRAEVISKINKALHQASPHTKIIISFIPPNAPQISEAWYTRSIQISVHGCTVADLLVIVARYDVDWKVTGNDVVGSQAHTD